jgi:hypothetical protein
MLTELKFRANPSRDGDAKPEASPSRARRLGCRLSNLFDPGSDLRSR